jgi:predicted permease
VALVADACTDVAHTWRLLSRHRVFALTAVLTLALGIGATTALFAVIDGVLLRPLPWPGADRLVRLSEWHPGARAAFPGPRLSDLTAAAWAASPKTIEAIAAWSSRTYTVTLGDEPRRLPGAEVSPSLFRLLRTPPAVGRFFVEAESQERAPAVVVLSAGLWSQAFAGDPRTVGRTVLIDRRPHLVVGVAPAGFAFPDAEARLWTPYAVPASPGNDGSMRVFSALSRLRPGASAVQAEAEGTAAARSVTRPMVADLIFGKGRAVEVRVRPLQEEMTASVRPALFLLASGVGVLLLVACANVANLLLSAGVARQRELAVRAALGAGHRRLLRQLLTESLVLSLAGGALGVLLASSLVSALPRLAPPDFPRLDGVRLDSRVVASAVLLSLVSVLAGIVPAPASGRASRAMRDGGLSHASHGQFPGWPLVGRRRSLVLWSAPDSCEASPSSGSTRRDPENVSCAARLPGRGGLGGAAARVYRCPARAAAGLPGGRGGWRREHGAVREDDRGR